MDIEKVRDILDKSKISAVDEINILEYIADLIQVKMEYFKSLDKLDVLDNRIDKAIEYLKDNACYENTISELFCDDLNYDNCMELLKILRGKEDE